MNNKKKLERDEPFAGLWIRTANALRSGGYRSRKEIKADIESDKLRPHLSIRDYGRKAHVEVVTWLVAHGDMTRSEALQRFRGTFGNPSMKYILAQMKEPAWRDKKPSPSVCVNP